MKAVVTDLMAGPAATMWQYVERVDRRVPVTPAATVEWVAVAHGARLSARLLANVRQPTADSNFARLDEIYPFDSVAVFTRGYLSASLEHLLFWADYAAPLKFHPEQEANFALRPAYTLARAALEAAAPAVWLMNADGPRECLRRYLSLVRWDLRMHAKSTPDTARKAEIEAQEAELLSRVVAEFTPKEIAPPAGYEAVIKAACAHNDVTLDPIDAAWIWRAASGSAHGMPWAATDLQEWITDPHLADPSPIRVPDVNRMAEALRAAWTVTSYGCLKFAAFSGGDLKALTSEARTWLASVVPLKPDADPDALAELRKASGDTAS